jgi:transcriptional regulator with PAS, ATPase and Fis domain
LFGHVKGSFTGAVKDKKGLFKIADGGSLFLDEVGETSPNFQVKLLRVLEDGTFRRVGGTEEQRIDVRIIAASNKELAQLVQQDHFRRDLYYRLKVIPIHLPPLRKRIPDIKPLAEHFVHRYANRMGRKRISLSAEAIDRLQTHTWPGNVRELENAIERALIFCQGEKIEASDLPLEACTPAVEQLDPEKNFADMTLRTTEKVHILRVLQHCQWNRSRAARELGIGYNTLWRKIKKYGIQPP